tara:strand:+ start:78 stop:641 length:564 start_codon:yes stop_codon:yes gene_type:complete
MKNIVPCFIFLVIAIIFANLGVSSFKEYNHAKAMHSWPIINATIKKVETPQVYRRFSSWVQGKNTTQLVNILKLEYSYSLNDISYVNDGMSWHDDFIIKEKSKLEYIKSDYAVGNKVNIIYNPQNPQESYILKPSYIENRIIGFAFFFVSLCFMFLIYYRITGKYKDDELEMMLEKAKLLEEQNRSR